MTRDKGSKTVSKSNSRTKQKAPVEAARVVLPYDGGSFPIVGIGASAGGLEAIVQLLGCLKDKSGIAFIIVQHLDPTRKDMMVELLQRVTPMKVLQIKNRMKVERDQVYVIPPDKDISILHGVLHLSPPTAPRGLRLPIDFFFRSLAKDRKAEGIAVILSGMGSDGTLGLAALKEQGGAVFVQDPASAKFDGMPRSAVDSGFADVVAPVEELAERLISFCKKVQGQDRSDSNPASDAQNTIEKICALLLKRTGHDFSQYKRNTVLRRIERRARLHRVDAGIEGYLKHLEESPQETVLLFKELLIGVTGFFRDPETWEHLKQQTIPALMSESMPAEHRVLRAWAAGCSTGEEAYSLAIAFKEAAVAAQLDLRCSLQIFATDLDIDAIDRARRGFYSRNIETDVSAERLRKFFVREEMGYRVCREIREMVIFAVQDVIADPPFTKIDILSCRNLLIYLTPALQQKLLSLFHYSLNPGGILVLGSAETLGDSSDLFSLKGGKMRIFRKLGGASKAGSVELPACLPGIRDKAEIPVRIKQDVPFQSATDQILLSRYSPSAVLTNEQGDILYISGRTGKYLEPAAGKADWNIQAMAREELRFELHSAFRNALKADKSVVKTRVKLTNNGTLQAVDIIVEPLTEPESLKKMVLVVFTEVAVLPLVGPVGKASKPSVATVEIERELRRTREEILTIREEMQTSQEELKSTNEELQSANEELQSTNEELTTSKEEMQSMNEELQTLNSELQAKLDELSRTNNDMRNLLDSTDIATLFLDDDLRVRRFTTQMTKIIKLIPSDLNRPVTDLASDLVYPELTEDAREVLKTLVFKETPIRTVDERWFSVRIMPYKTLDNRIDGLVITFANITAAKTLEATLRQNQTEQTGDDHKGQADHKKPRRAGALHKKSV